MSETWPPPAAGAFYPRKDAPLPRSWLDRLVERVVVLPRHRLAARPSRLFAWRVLRWDRQLQQLDDDELDRRVRVAAQALRAARGRPPTARVVETFALIRECAGRTLGLRHYRTQILAARAVLNGAVAEMQTGEGKTLAVTLASATAALAGRQVHVITANDYLAKRDAEKMGPLYARLGLEVSAIREGMPTEGRRTAFAADIVYASGKEVAFTYLRDRVAMGARSGDLGLRARAFLDGHRFLLPGLQFAIVDEADSVMIDEARTPLILSAPPADAETDAAAASAAGRLAELMVEGRHYRQDRARHRIDFTDLGRGLLADRAGDLPGGWRPAPIREDAVRLALSARHFHRLGEHYILREGKVEIVDEYTGRVMPDRSWSAGLHQAVEAKEGVEITTRRVTLAQITFQRFFRRYLHLGGMTGTARESAGEFWDVYRLPVVSIPTHRPSRRRRWPDRVTRSEAAKWALVARRAKALSQAGRPVLIGTRTVTASEAASAALVREGVAHRVLSAAQDADEAAVVADAGRSGAVTVATNMAGRGTDIVPDAQSLRAGGLHVIVTERHSAGRIDRQLAGRAGRQGDPGSTEAILSADDPILREFGTARERFLARLGSAFTLTALGRAQRRAERRHAAARRQLLTLDEQLAESLAFTGAQE